MRRPFELIDIDDVAEMMDILGDDLEESFDLLMKGATDRDVRSFVRTAFAYVEGFQQFIRQLLLNPVHCDQAKFAPDDIRQLKEEKNPPYKDQVKHTLKLAAKMFRPYEAIDFNGVDWGNMVFAIDVRDRLTHPKKKSDLVIDNLTFRKMYMGVHWYHDLAQNIVLALRNRARLQALMDFDELRAQCDPTNPVFRMMLKQRPPKSIGGMYPCRVLRGGLELYRPDGSVLVVTYTLHKKSA